MSLLHVHVSPTQKKADGPTDPQQAAKRKPPAEAQTIPPEVVPITMTTTPSAANADALKQQIDSQGQKVRELKASGGTKVTQTVAGIYSVSMALILFFQFCCYLHIEY